MDVIARAAVVFAFLWLLSRLTGKRELSQISAFEFIVIVTIGDLIGPTVMQENYSITAGFLAATVFFVLAYTFATVSRRWPRAGGVLEGRPTLLISDGEVDQTALQAENLSIDDLMESARSDGITSLSDVRLAVMESTGRISFVTRN
jgi:uncharacterized membrane protein YcaP (DUF421 family)